MRTQKNNEGVPKKARVDFRIEGTTAFMVMTKRSGLSLGTAMIDAVDVERVAAFRFWYPNHDGYIVNLRQGATTLLHRLVIGAVPGEIVDHINANKSDNRRANLRIVTHAQNMQNARLQKNSRSGIKNVYSMPGGRWAVRITLDGKNFFCGVYGTLQAAEIVASGVRRHLHTHSPENSVDD